MENYKIRVNNEARADEAKELFKKLGYHPDNSSYKPYVEWIAVFEDGSGSFYSHNVNLNECVEITIDQLRDLVVLKRNDINDATHIDVDRRAYLDSEGKYHFYIHAENKWEYSQDVQYVGKYLKPINKPQDPALISGAEAKLAWVNGKDVEYQNKVDLEGIWLDLTESNILGIFTNDRFIFRIKPQTIKLEIELPKPFEPKEGEWFYYLSAEHEDGYGSRIMHDDTPRYLINLGAYRTEDEIKQVVEQLRKIKGAV